MARTTRSRSKSYTVSMGTYRERYGVGQPWSSNLGATSVTTSDTCADSSGMPYVDSNLNITKEHRNPLRVSGQTPPTTALGGWWVNNVPQRWALSNNWTGYANAKAALDSSVPGGAEAAQAVARSNPSRPLVDIPVFLWELHEVPLLLRNTFKWLLLLNSRNGLTAQGIIRRGFEGVSLDSEIAGQYLAWQFGWKPLISDLWRILTFTDVIAKRVRELEQLYERGITRRISLESNTIVSTGRYPSSGSQNCSYSGGSLAISGYTPWTSTRSTWATVRWKASGKVPTPDHLHRLALRSALGLNVDFATLWEIIPWSWLIDWFGSFGDYLESKRNYVGGTVESINIMRHSKVRLTYVVTAKPSYVSVTSNGYIHWERKRRVVSVTPAPEFRIPILQRRQWGILSSLAIQKLGNRSLLRNGPR